MQSSLKTAILGIGLITVVALGTFILYLTQPASQLTGLGQSTAIAKNAEELRKYTGIELSGKRSV